MLLGLLLARRVVFISSIGITLVLLGLLLARRVIVTALFLALIAINLLVLLVFLGGTLLAGVGLARALGHEKDAADAADAWRNERATK